LAQDGWNCRLWTADCRFSIADFRLPMDIGRSSLSHTRAARTGGSDQEAEAYAFLNDQEQAVGGDIIEALKAYRVTPAVWSQRRQYVAGLAG